MQLSQRAFTLLHIVCGVIKKKIEAAFLSYTVYTEDTSPVKQKRISLESMKIPSLFVCCFLLLFAETCFHSVGLFTRGHEHTEVQNVGAC